MEVHTVHITTSTVSLYHPIMIHLDPTQKHMIVPIVAGSDAHFPFEVGRAFTRVDVPHLTAEAVVTAILEGRVEPRIRESQVDRVRRTAYRYVHRYHHS
jgi:hypothetical protein